MRARRAISAALALGLSIASPAGAYTTNPDGSLVVSTSLTALPPIVAGQPLYPPITRNGHHYVAFGLNDNLIGPSIMTSTQVVTIAAADGASFVRLDVAWPTLEPTEGGFHWDYTDAEYSAFVSQGIRPMWIIDQTPNWAVGADKSSCAGTAYGVANLYCQREPDAAHLAGLTTFAAELARRYPLAAGFEYRNEPNLSAVSDPHASHGNCTGTGWFVDPALYTTDLQAFASGVRSTRPDMRIWGGALSNCPNRYSPYAAAMLDDGATNSMSGLSWHPYDSGTTNTSQYDAELADMYATISAHGHADLRLIAGEVGANINGGFSTSQQSTHLQAQYTAIGQDSSLTDHHDYDAFVGFNEAAGSSSVDPGFGWLGPKNALGKWPARQVYCDWRTLLGITTSLPSYVLPCLP